MEREVIRDRPVQIAATMLGDAVIDIIRGARLREANGRQQHDTDKCHLFRASTEMHCVASIILCTIRVNLRSIAPCGHIWDLGEGSTGDTNSTRSFCSLQRGLNP